jgi:hypothetical protein
MAVARGLFRALRWQAMQAFLSHDVSADGPLEPGLSVSELRPERSTCSCFFYGDERRVVCSPLPGFESQYAWHATGIDADDILAAMATSETSLDPEFTA